MVERRLGRGLDFFLSDAAPAAPAPGAEPPQDTADVEVSRLVPNPHQPRREFSVAELEQLASSIRANGVLQPILARKVGDQLQIVAGERRWRAAKMVGLERIPAVVREMTDEAAAVISLVENVQRADLNAIEKAQAFRRLQQLLQLSQDDVARRVGLDRSTVANFVRLLELPAAVQTYVSRGTLTMGHARALLALRNADEQRTVAEEVIRKKLSVRQVEELVRSLNEAAPTGPATAGEAKAPMREKAGRPVWVGEVEQTLKDALGSSVAVRYGRKRSRIMIECIGREQFERVYELLKTLGQKMDRE